ncbi:MAG: hypothetical protein AAB420_03275 [Patescibacteria group bacterium]
MDYQDKQLEQALHQEAQSIKPPWGAVKNIVENLPEKRVRWPWLAFVPVVAIVAFFVVSPAIPEAEYVQIEVEESGEVAVMEEELAMLDEEFITDLDILDDESIIDDIVGVLSLSKR